MHVTEQQWVRIRDEVKLLEASPYFHKERETLLIQACKRVKVPGLWLEFGVAQGYSLKIIAQYASKVYGFDSFEGLPRDWWPGYEKGKFKQDKLPQVAPNAELVVGLFEDTLEPFLTKNTEPCAFIHIDCDLRESTWIALALLSPRIGPGTVIAFDEINGPDNNLVNEMAAWLCFADSFKYEYIGHCWSEQAALIIL
jgi:predicted O-methyltransferase YrrM